MLPSHPTLTLLNEIHFTMPVNEQALDVWKESVLSSIGRLEETDRVNMEKLERLSDRVTKSDIKATALLMLWSLNALLLGFSLYKIYDVSLLVGKFVK